MIRALLVLVALSAVACRSTSAPACPVPGGVLVDHLILPEETHFAHLWQLSFGGENAEAYWNFAGDALSLQRSDAAHGIECDRIFVTTRDGALEQVSDGRGVTTCSYFLPDGRRVLFASTTAVHDACPPRPDRSQGYVWPLHAGYDIYVTDLATRETRPLITGPGYDAEATVSPTGDRIVFTSLRSGDVELYTCDLAGGDVRQVTDEPGYDGGAFFSHDGEWLVFRTTAFTPGREAEELADYERLLGEGLVQPSRMELILVRSDGSQRTQLTALGAANFAPSFFPDDGRVIFSTNHHDDARPALNFDLFAIDVDGGGLERITYFDGETRGKKFDGFPLFSPDGRYLAFSSNRGDGEDGETNVFVAEWH
jgi:dipeptidyl aminopeptidase/acylaminoacyl peptidase